MAFEFAAKSEISGDYYEFGSYEGFSLINAFYSSSHYGFANKYYIFDSFEGLPELEDGEMLEGYNVFEKGQYSCSEDRLKDILTQSGVVLDDFHFIKGFYSASLKDENNMALTSNSDIAIAHIDCDLESSARDVLQFIEGKLQDGAVLLFDDWFCFKGRSDKGVKKAFLDWQQNSKWQCTEYFCYSWAGICFIVSEKP